MDRTEVYYFDGQKIIETRDGSGNMVRQFIHGTQYIDELVMMRAAGERSEREQPATGKASKDARVRVATWPEEASTTRAPGGKGDLYVHQDANWNVIALTDLGGSVVERYVYTPYGEVTVHQGTSYGDCDGDQDVDSTDKGTVGSTCTGTVSGSCRILDLDFDADYDSTDAAKFDALAQGLARHPGRSFTGVDQPFAEGGLIFDTVCKTYLDGSKAYDPVKRRLLQRVEHMSTRTTRTADSGPLASYGRAPTPRFRFDMVDPPIIYMPGPGMGRHTWQYGPFHAQEKYGPSQDGGCRKGQSQTAAMHPDFWSCFWDLRGRLDYCVSINAPCCFTCAFNRNAGAFELASHTCIGTCYNECGGITRAHPEIERVDCSCMCMSIVVGYYVN